MKSIGKILQAKRLKKNYTIEDVYKHIKIHPKYIKALEIDDYSIFDSKVHSKGFLKIYTQFLDIDIEEILALWRREYEHDFDTKETGKQNRIAYLEPERISLTPNLVFMTFFFVVLVGFFGFLFFQYRNYTDAPQIEIFHPQDNLVHNRDFLDITGKVELDSDIFINGQRVLINTDGTFLTSIKLREGINTISIRAVNKLSKETELIRTVIYRPDPVIITAPQEELNKDSTLNLVEEIDIPVEN